MTNERVSGADVERDVFNYDALLNHLDGDRSILMEVVEVFLKDVQGRIDRIEKAFGVSDHQAVAADAHTIKGSAGVISANRLLLAAEKLHQVASVTEDDGIDGAVEELRKSFAELRSRLEKL